MREIEGIKEVVAVLGPYWEQIEEDFNHHNNRYLQLAATNHEAIGRILRAHLIIENFINGFISKNFKDVDFDELKLSFSQKAKLLPKRNSSAAFVRPGIIELNNVRNKFAHRLKFVVDFTEITGISSVLKVSRPSIELRDPVDAIEAFAPVACAFLSVPPPHLQEAFISAFKKLRSRSPT